MAKDPTVKGPGGPDYPEGTHPALTASDTHHAASKLTYSDAKTADKASVAQEQDVPKGW